MTADHPPISDLLRQTIREAIEAGRILLSAILGLLLVAAVQSGQEQPMAKVGQVIIIGNTATKDSIIRGLINIYPGQEFSLMQLQLAEQNLMRSGRFEVDPKRGIRPTVTVIEDPLNPDSEFKDILIRIQERPNNRRNVIDAVDRLYRRIVASLRVRS